MNKSRGNILKKTLLSASIATALSLGIMAESQADIYEFTFDNGGCSVPATGPGTNCTGPGDGVFTILNPSGAPTGNSSFPYFGDATWGYGQRTQIGGSLTIDIASGLGAATINPFDFFASGSAVASNITFADIDDSNDPTGNLWLTQLLFTWNGNTDIPVSLAWDLQGILDNVSGLAIGGTIEGVGAVPGSSDGLKKGQFPIGASPVATTVFDTTNLCGDADGIPGNADDIACALGLNPSGGLPLVSDTASVPGTATTGSLGVGGSPMIAGPFTGFGANFDISKLTLSKYADQTAPVLNLPTTSVTVSLGGSFDSLNPGVSVTCTDNADGTDNITSSVGTNANIAFTVGGATVDVNTEANYVVTYTCTDNANARPAITDDPNNPGSPSVPADNTSSVKSLTVTVSDVDRPVISVSSPVTHEACTAYTNTADNTGLSATDLQDGVIPVGSIVKSGFTFGTSPDESVLNINYNFTDSGTGNPGSTLLAAATQTRTVNVIDSLPPIIAISGGATIGIESTACVAFNASLPTATVTDANSDCNATTSPISTASTVICEITDGQDTQVSTLIYSASDTATTPNSTSENAIITVSRSEPVITLIGGGVVLNIGDTYTEEGMNIHDVQDGDVNAVTFDGTASNITYTIAGAVDTTTSGSYTLTYDATDNDGNTAISVERVVQVGVFAQGSNFTMLNPAGTTFGGTNDVTFDWDQTLNTSVSDTNFNMSIASALPQPFFSFVWIAHDIRVFGPGTYQFDATCTVTQLRAGTAACNNPVTPPQEESGRFISMVVGPGQIGAHILFDWNGNVNIDVVNVWDQDGVWGDLDGVASTINNLFDGDSGLAPDPTASWKLVSTDFDNDGVIGSSMVDGPFIGFSANFNAGPSGSVERVPYTDVVTDEDFTSKPGAGSMGLIASLLSLFALAFGVSQRRKNK